MVIGVGFVSPRKDKTMSTIPQVSQWTEDQKAEQVLKSLGLEFEYTAIEPSQIDRKASRVNRASIEPINNETAREYAASFERNAVFPAIVVCSGPNGYVIAG